MASQWLMQRTPHSFLVLCCCTTVEKGWVKRLCHDLCTALSTLSWYYKCWPCRTHEIETRVETFGVLELYRVWQWELKAKSMEIEFLWNSTCFYWHRWKLNGIKFIEALNIHVRRFQWKQNKISFYAVYVWFIVNIYVPLLFVVFYLKC